MPRTILGKVSLTPKGEYSPDTAYTALDVVSYGGNSWLALQSVTGVAPVEGENWMLLAQKGDQGASFTRLEKTAGTGAPGTIDTYTAYNSEGEEAGNIKVYNGMDGTGAGDFKADGTVPMTGDLQMDQHRVTGLADATEDGDAVNKGQMDAALEGVTVTTDAAPTEDSTNPVQSGGVFDALAGKADLTLSNLSNYQKALAAIGGKPRDNLLDNAYFAGGGSQQGGGQFPINQRGFTSAGAGNTRTFDRWGIYSYTNGTVSLDPDGVSISGTLDFGSPLEGSRLPRIPGLVITLSALNADGQLATITASLLNNGTMQIVDGLLNWGGNGYLRYIRNWNNLDKDLFYFDMTGYTGPKIVAAKLELGPTQTLAYQDEEGNWQLFETPDYAEELAKCQRYFFPVMERNKISGTTVTAKSTGQKGACIFIPLPCNMRAVPTASVSGTALCELNNGNTQYPITDIYTARMASNVVKLNITCSGGGLTAEKDYPLTNPNTDSYLFLSAEL